MHARKLKPGEGWYEERNGAVAFEYGIDLEKEKEKAKEEKESGKEDFWGIFSQEGPNGGKEPVASFVMNLFDARFDGHVIKMGGVGGVATLPAYRRGGAIRTGMEAALRDLYDRGFAFSSLYPFSTAFYRKFGFENGEICWFWEIPLKNLPQADVGGRVYQLFPGDDLAPLLDVYDQVYGEVNLAVLREVYDKGLAEKNLLEEKRYIFVWEDGTGRPGAFLIGGRDGEVLNCRTNFDARNGFLFRDAEALTAMLSFVRTAFFSNYEKVRFTTPGYMEVSSLIPEVTAEGRGFFFNGMVRAVNAQLVLGLCRCRGEGTVTLTVTDPMLPENNDTFRLSFGPGRENAVERVKDPADLVLGVGELGQLLCGVKGVDDLPWMPGVQVRNSLAPLEQVFYRKPCHILELF